MDLKQIQDKIIELKQKYDDIPLEAASTLHDKVQLAWCVETLEKLSQIVTNADTNKTEKLAAIEVFLRLNWERVQDTFLSSTASPHLDVANLLIDIAEFVATEKDKECIIIESESVPTELDQINFDGCASACIRVNGREVAPSFLSRDSILHVEQLPADFTGYVRCKNEADQDRKALYYIDKRKGLSIQLHLRQSDLDKFDEDLVDGTSLSPASIAKAKEALNHPRIPNQLYFAHKQKGEIFSLQAKAEQLDQFDGSLQDDPRRKRPLQEIQGFSLEEIRKRMATVPLGLLMPTLQLTSYADRYPDLGTDTRGVLRTHILDTGGCDLHLMSELPASFEQYKNSYIFIKKDETSELYYVKSDGVCELAQIDDFDLFEEQIKAIKNKEDTQLHLNERQIKEIVTSNGGHTHTTRRFLLPVAELAELAGGQREQGLLNPYTDPAVGSPYYSIDSEQGRRLIEHSAVTRNIHAKIQAYEALAHDRSNLLGQLNQFCEQLNANSAAGRGREDNAAGGAYPAIIAFMGYYASLTPCGLQVKKEVPTADNLGLPDGRTLGYVLVKPNEDSFEGAQLYFINTLDGDNPIKPICDAQTPLRFGLLLVKVDTLHEQVFSKEQPSVIFDKETSKYYLYGKPAGEDWKLTELDAEAVSSLFPEDCAAERERPLGNVPTEIYEEIAKKNAHAETLPQCLKTLHSDEDSASPIESGSFEQLMMLSAMTGHSYLKAPSHIPPKLLKEINLLFDLVIDPTSNVNATENLATCIATRRDALMAAMIGHDSELAAISLSGTRKEELVAKASSELAIAKTDLETAIESPLTLDGRDSLGITSTLLKSFGIEISLTNIQDMNLFCTLQPDEIKSILQGNEPLRTEIIIILGFQEDDGNVEVNEAALGNLVALCIDLTPDRLRAFFSVMSKDIMKSLKTLKGFAELLVSLPPEKCRILCESMKEGFSELNTTAHDFKEAFAKLSPTQRPIFWEAIKEGLLEIIQSGSDFSTVIEPLSEDQRTALLDAMNAKLPEIIQSGSDFRDALELLSEVQRAALLDTMNAKLPEIIQSGSDFKDALELLSVEQRIVLFHAMQNKLPEIIRNSAHFRDALKFLPEVQRTIIFERLKEELPSKITLLNHLSDVLKQLTVVQGSIILSQIQGKLSAFFNAPHTIGSCLMSYPPEQCGIVVNAIKDILDAKITSSFELTQLLQYLGEDNFSIVVDAMKDKLPNIIRNRKEIHDVLDRLRPGTCSIMVEAMNDILAQRIQSMDDFDNASAGLSIENRSILTSAMKDELPRWIRSAIDIACILNDLPQDQRSSFLEAIKDNLPLMIKSGTGLWHVLKHLTPDQRNFVFKAIIPGLPLMIHSAVDLNKTLEHLTELQRSHLFPTMTEMLSTIPYNNNEFNSSLEYIPKNQLAEFFVAILAREGNLTRIGLEDFFKATRALSPEDLHRVLLETKDQLPFLIPSVEPFIQEVIQNMEPDEKSRYFKAMAPVLSGLIQSPGDVDALAVALTSEIDKVKITLLRTLVSKPPIDPNQIALIISSDEPEKLLLLDARREDMHRMKADLANLRQAAPHTEAIAAVHIEEDGQHQDGAKEEAGADTPTA